MAKAVRCRRKKVLPFRLDWRVRTRPVRIASAIFPRKRPKRGTLMQASDVPGLQGRFLQAVFSRRFEGKAGYILGVAAVLSVFALQLTLSDLMNQIAICVPFLPIVLVAAIIGGIGPGALALGLSLASIAYIAGATPVAWLQLPVLGIIGLAIVWMGETLHHARRVIESAQEALSSREAHVRSILDTVPDAT